MPNRETHTVDANTFARLVQIDDPSLEIEVRPIDRHGSIDDLCITLETNRTRTAVADAIIEVAFDEDRVTDEAISSLDASGGLVGCVVQTILDTRAVLTYVRAMRNMDESCATIFVGEHLMRTCLRHGVALAGPNAGLGGWLQEIDLASRAPNPTANLGAVIKPFSSFRPDADVAHASTDFSGAADAFGNLTGFGLTGVLGPKVVAAGGAVLGALTGATVGDIDLFMICDTLQEAVEIMQRSIEKISANLGESPSWYAATACTVTVKWPNVHLRHFVCFPDVQFVMRAYKSVAQVLASFDMGPTRFAYDGQRFLGMASAMYAVSNRIAFPDPLMATSPTRAAKYHLKGFEYVVPCWPGLTDIYMSVLGMTSEGELRNLRAGIKGILAHAHRISMLEGKRRQLAKAQGSDEEYGKPKSHTIMVKLHDNFAFPPAHEKLFMLVMEANFEATDPMRRMFVADPRDFFTA